ncbi:MAG: dethiobiotin synthase [Alphaproteobacteria bacterium]|nr:dethiobiotin synthase [Alphaproteobacteria bacterium]
MSGYFITATGTGLGKTYLTCGVIDALTRRDFAVDAVKPVISGFAREAAAESDSGLILQALGRSIDDAALDDVSPWRFRAALSPDMAAERENAVVPAGGVGAFCARALENAEGVCLIEGAGGLMSPLGRDFTNLDLLALLDVRVVLVAGTYLGTISHTLTACAALAARGREPWAIVLSQSVDDPVTPSETAASMGRFVDAPIYLMPRGGGVPDDLVETMLG